MHTNVGYKPLPYTHYTLASDKIICKHNIHFYCYVNYTRNQISKDLKAWMTNNFLLLNSEKTDIVPGPEQLRKSLSKDIIDTLDGI